MNSEWLYDLKDWLRWNLWQRWVMKWRNRNKTLDEQLDELRHHWNEYLKETANEPEGRAKLEAVEGMDEVFKSLEKEQPRDEG